MCTSEIAYFNSCFNFPSFVALCSFEWNKLSVTWKGENALNLTSQMRRKEVVKAFWGGNVSLNWMC